MRRRLASPLPLIDSLPLSVLEAAKRVFEIYTTPWMLRAVDMDFPRLIQSAEDCPTDGHRYGNGDHSVPTKSPRSSSLRSAGTPR